MSHPHPELTSPPELAKHAVRIVALGGLGEVGRNMTVIEYAGRLLIVDCGVLFPEDHHPGVDLILPDFEYIENRLDDIDAIVLTHGHEDHIGAVPYLLRLKGDIPLIGSTLTLAMVEAKLREYKIRPFTLAVTEGQDIPTALRFASAAAALKCTRFGGAFAAPQRAEVEELLSHGQAADADRSGQ